MSFTLNAGEFDLGAGFIGRGTILTGEAYALGTATTGVQGLLNTSGLEGICYSYSKQYQWYFKAIAWRASNDALTDTISVPSEDSNGNTATTWTGRGAPTVQPYTSQLPNAARFHSVIQIRSDSYQGTVLNGYLSHLNASTTNSKVVVSPSPGSQIYENLNNINLELFGDSLLWRFLARDHATALIHYPGTNEEGSVFAASCINSATQWGLWIAGEVGDRSSYFNQTQGYFAIVLLVDGANTYFSAFSPSAENSTTRNDSRMRAVNILPKPGQSGDDRFSELLLFRDQGSGYSERLGTVPGLIYIDMNRVENAELVVGDKLTIEPGLGTTYNLTNKGALIVAQWGRDISATISNLGSLFTVSTISSPISASLAVENRNRWILENNQRIRFTATPPVGVSAGVDYWIKNWDPIAFTFQIADTEGGATIVPGGDASSTIVRYAPLIAMPCYAA